jgi:hypothetical protein
VAHSEYRQGERRKHANVFPCGTKVGLHTTNGVVYGTITHADPGGWVYVDRWVNGDGGTHYPQPSFYFRSTNVFKVADAA